MSETQAPPAQPVETDITRAMASGAVLDSFTAGTDAALAEAVDGLVWGALALAGRKLLHTPVVPRPARGDARNSLHSAEVHTRHPVPSEDAVDGYHLLDGAWVRVPVIAARYGIDAVELASALHDYARSLLTTGVAHEFDNVPRLLAQVRIRTAVAA